MTSSVVPQTLELVFALTSGLTAALVFGVITRRLGLSPIVGYLLAGVVIGPFTPGFVAHPGVAAELAELGVILLMFGVGLDFHVKDLWAVRAVAVPGAIVQIAVATGLGTVVGRAMGWSLASGVVFGLAVSVASTVVLVRVLSDRGSLQTPSGHLAVGWLVVEDLFTVFVLVLLPSLVSATGEAGGGTARVAITRMVVSLAIALLKLGLLVLLVFVAGRRWVPSLLRYAAATRSRELFTLTVLVVALGVAVGSAELFGTSIALGAFLAGLVVGQSEFSSRAASEALPMRDAFAVLFFVSVGMLFDPRKLVPNAGLTLATLAVVVAAKPLAALAAVRLLGRSARTGLLVGIALAQIGEFTFILAELGRDLGVLPERAIQALVASSIVSITVNPLLFRLGKPIGEWLGPRMLKRGPMPAGTEPQVDHAEVHRAIVVGYGPVGRAIVALLRENDIEPTVIDLNHEAVVELRRAGTHAIYGDASQPLILEHSGIREATSLVFAAGGVPPAAVVRAAKEVNPQITIIARSTYAGDIAASREAGADVVVSAEIEVALAIVEHLLARLGATREQLDRARDRVRHEIGGGAA